MALPARLRVWGAWLVSLAITVGLFAWLLSDVDLRELAALATRAGPMPLAAFAALMAASILFRAARFWILLGRAVPLGLLTGITMVRNLFVDLLPVRMGELSYVYLVTSRTGRPVEEALATVVLAVLLDVIALAPLLVLAVLVIGGTLAAPAEVLMAGSVAIAAVGVVALRLAAPVTVVAARVLERHAPAALARLAPRLRLLAATLAEARARGRLLPALGLSLLLRLCKYGSVYCLMLAVLTPLGYTAANLGFFPVFIAAISAEVAAALPLHGIGGFGTYETAWTLTFSRLGFPREHAIASGILGHLFGQVAEYVVGAAALAWIMWPGARLRRGRGPE